MKFAVAVLLVVAVASPLNAYVVPPAGSGALAREMQDFVDLVPMGEMIELAKVYASEDEQFRTVMSYMTNVETREWIKFIESHPKFVSLINYVQNSGLDIYHLMNVLNKALNLSPLIQTLRNPMIRSNVQITGGVQGFISDMAKLMPLEKVKDMFEDKMEHSKVVKDLIHEILTDQYIDFFISVFNNVHYKRLESMVVAIGVDRNTFQTFVPIFLSTYVIITL